MSGIFAKFLAMLTLLLLPNTAFIQQHQLMGFHDLGLAEDDFTWDDGVDDEEDDLWFRDRHDVPRPRSLIMHASHRGSSLS